MSRTTPPHPIRAIIDKAIERMRALELPHETAVPTHADIDKFLDSLLAWAAIADAVTLAYGVQAYQQFGLSKRDLDDCFYNQLVRALSGNVDHALQEAYREHFRQ